MDMQIVGVDLVVVGLLLISAVIGLARGFIRELLTISAFIAATLAALWGSPPLWQAAEGAVGESWAAKAAVVIGVFLAVHVGVTMVTGSVTNLIHRNEQVGLFDRILGLGFGLMRGVFIAALMLLLYNLAIPTGQHRPWLTEARSYPYLLGAAELIQKAAPPTALIAARALPPVE